MDEIESKKKINTLIRWVFGVFFLFSSLVMFSSSFIAGLLFLLAAVVSIPPAAAEFEKKLNISIPGIVQFFIVFFLVAVAISATPHTPVAVNNSTTTIAAPPSTASNSETIAVPSEPAQVATPTPTLTPKPEVTPTKTLADKEPDSNYVTTDTPTPTSKLTSTSTSEASNYQDTQWLAVCGADTSAVTDDINSMSTAAQNYDFTSMSTSANALYTDSQKAMDDSDLYNVSPDLQGAKDEYRLAMV
jgi:hypothetical protein